MTNEYLLKLWHDYCLDVKTGSFHRI